FLCHRPDKPSPEWIGAEICETGNIPSLRLLAPVEIRFCPENEGAPLPVVARLSSGGCERSLLLKGAVFETLWGTRPAGSGMQTEIGAGPVCLFLSSCINAEHKERGCRQHALMMNSSHCAPPARRQSSILLVA